MKTTHQLFGKIIYALLFVIAIPILLYYWAKSTDFIIRYTIVIDPYFGLILGIIGLFIIFWGMLALVVYGKGLPMNAYPPRNYVKGGPYRWFKHPIYWGFGFFVVGFSVFLDLRAGLWLVAPITILSMIALVWGYEQQALKERFPDEELKTLFSLKNDLSVPNFLDRIATVIHFLFFYIISNFIIISLTRSHIPLVGDTWDLWVFQEKMVMGILTLCYILLPIVIINKRSVLKKWRSVVLITMLLLTFSSLLWPEIWAQFYLYEGLNSISIDIFVKSVFSISICYTLISMYFMLKNKSKWKYILAVLGVPIMAFQLSVSNSSVLHFTTGLILFFIVINSFRIWNMLKKTSEKIANSWREWTFGDIRIINHGFYVGFGAFLGILIAGYLVGAIYAWALLVFAVAVIIFSALWAQLIEGSEKLKRPFGYYGALVGILFGSLLVYLMKVEVWVIIGVVSVVMPWVQAIGRFRCLINGCCHGSKTKSNAIGIRYFHFRSRVCGISNMKGELLHPTQLYAIIWLFFIGLVLLELWINNFSYSFIFGLYLMLTGIGRFVEEAFRGEIQTVIWKGLRLYQWTAIISVVIGIAMTFIHTETVTLTTAIDAEVFIAALIGGLITFFAMGVDFPNSNARFSRLV